MSPSPAANLAGYGKDTNKPLEGRGACCFAPFCRFGMREQVAMTSEQVLQETELSSHSVINELRRHGWSMKACGAAAGLCGGILAAVVACVLTIAVWVTHAAWHGLLLQRSGTVLFFLMIPLVVFGALCLDLLDSEEKGTSNDLETDKGRG